MYFQASQRAICFLCGDSFGDEDHLKAHLAVVHLGKVSTKLRRIKSVKNSYATLHSLEPSIAITSTATFVRCIYVNDGSSQLRRPDASREDVPRL